MNLNRILRHEGQRGQSMAEFIIVVPTLTLMLYSVLYFGKAVVYKGRVAMAARYWVFKNARGFSPANINQNFFSDVGPNNANSSSDTTPWMNLIGLTSYFIAFAANDQALEGAAVFLNPNVYEFATQGEVSYSYTPPAYLSYIGSHRHEAGLMLDANPWQWPTLNWTLNMEFFLMFYALHNDWEPWALPMPWMLGFPRWWALTPWFPLPPYPRYDF